MIVFGEYCVMFLKSVYVSHKGEAKGIEVSRVNIFGAWDLSRLDVTKGVADAP